MLGTEVPVLGNVVGAAIGGAISALVALILGSLPDLIEAHSHLSDALSDFDETVPGKIRVPAGDPTAGGWHRHTAQVVDP